MSMLKLAACGLLVILAASVAAAAESLPADGEQVLAGKTYGYMAEPQFFNSPKDIMNNPRLLVSDRVVTTSNPNCKITLRIAGETVLEDTTVSFSPFLNASLSFSKAATIQVSTEQNKFRLGGVLGGVAVMLLAPALVTVPFVHRLGMFLVSTVVFAVYLVVRDSRPSRLIPVAFLGIVAAMTLHKIVLGSIQRLDLEQNIALVAGLFVVFSIVSYTQLEATGDPADLQRFVQIALQVVALVAIEMSCHDVTAGWLFGLILFVASAFRTLFNEAGAEEAAELAATEREQEQEAAASTTTHLEKHEMTTVGTPTRDGSGDMQFVTLVSDDEADIQEGGSANDSYGTARVRETHRRRQYVTRSSSMQDRHESLLSEDEEPEPATTRATRRTRSTRSSARRSEQSLPQRPQRPQRARPQRTRSSTRGKTAAAASSSSPTATSAAAAAAASPPARATRATRRSAAKAASAQSPGRRVYTKDELANMSNQEVSAALSARGINRPVTDSTRPYVEKLLLK